MKYIFYASIGCMLLCTCCKEPSSVYMEAVLEGEKWIRSGSIRNGEMISWLPNPDDTVYRSNYLYHGNAGVILFYLDLYNTTKDESYLREAEMGGNFLIKSIPDTLPDPYYVGLYTGLAGASYTLEQIYKAGHKKKYRDHAIHYLDRIIESGKRENGGMEWGGITDIIYGSSGIGLYLLHAYRNMGYERGIDAAIQIGNHLLESAVDCPVGIQWPMITNSPEPVIYMPNFSHGTAGVAYFLTSLYHETGESRFLDAALAGADYLASISNPDGLICHHIPGGEDLFYLGWCHGPVGTGRLYYALYRVTGEREWLDKLTVGAHTLMHSGIPEMQQPGFWNNVSQCCGSAGVGQYFLNLYQITAKKEYLDFVFHLTDDLVNRASRTEDGWRWIQAEHRTQPDLLIAQTGYMQGSAGICSFFLRLNNFLHEEEPEFMLPDTPFTY